MLFHTTSVKYLFFSNFNTYLFKNTTCNEFNTHSLLYYTVKQAKHFNLIRGFSLFIISLNIVNRQNICFFFFFY